MDYILNAILASVPVSYVRPDSLMFYVFFFTYHVLGDSRLQWSLLRWACLASPLAYSRVGKKRMPLLPHAPAPATATTAR